MQCWRFIGFPAGLALLGVMGRWLGAGLARGAWAGLCVGFTLSLFTSCRLTQRGFEVKGGALRLELAHGSA